MINLTVEMHNAIQNSCGKALNPLACHRKKEIICMMMLMVFIGQFSVNLIPPLLSVVNFDLKLARFQNVEELKIVCQIVDSLIIFLA